MHHRNAPGIDEEWKFLVTHMRGIDHLAVNSRRGLHLGIRDRLFIAFGGVASLTLVASLVALLSYNYIGHSFAHIEYNGIPTITNALVVARAAAELSDGTAALAQVTDRAELDQAVGLLATKRRAMAASLDRLARTSIDRRLIEALRHNAKKLDVGAERLAASVEKRLIVSRERRHVMSEAVADHRKLTEKLAPLFDDAGFDLLISLQSARENRGHDATLHALDKLANDEAPALVALADIRSEANLDIGILGEVALAPNPDLLPPLLDRFTAGSHRAIKAAASLGDDARARDLRALLHALLALGDGAHGIFAVRRRELNAVSEGWSLVAVNQAYAKQLATEVEAVVASARQTSASAMAAARNAVQKSAALLIGLTLINFAIAAAIGFLYVDRLVIRRLVRLNEAMLTLADGNLDAAIPHGGHDEISRMASAVEVFKGNALQTRALEAEKAKERAWKEERQRVVEYHIVAFDKSGNELAKAVAAASIEMDATARAMSSSAQGTSKEATAVNTAAEQAAVCAQSAAHAAEEMSICIQDISNRMSDSSKIAGRAVTEVKRADATIQGLAEAADRIGEVVDLIREVAAQTNLLALNATIEAARAGSVGKGFAGVAGEVKNLAAMTGKATAEIAAQIAGVQSATQDAVAAIDRIGTTIIDMNEISTAVASAMSQQATATNAIAEAVQTAAVSTRQVNQSIQRVEAAAASTGNSAAQVMTAATDLGLHAEALHREIGHFLGQIRAA